MSSVSAQLCNWFTKNAVVTDIEKGYIVVSKLNIVLDTKMLGLVTAAWAGFFRGKKIDAVVGLPDAAGRLVPQLAASLAIPQILPGKKRSYPKGWEGLGTVVEYEADSFTGPTQEVVKAFILVPNDVKSVLVIDDVAATGAVGTAAITALQKNGVQIVGMGVIFDKVWQGGVIKIQQETGVRVHSLVTVEKILPSGQLQIRR